MAKTAKKKPEPTSITLTVRVDLHNYWTEREVREDLLPPRVFDALAQDLAQAVLQRIHEHDVQAIRVGEPARRNFARTFATAATWRKWGRTLRSA